MTTTSYSGATSSIVDPAKYLGFDKLYKGLTSPGCGGCCIFENCGDRSSELEADVTGVLVGCLKNARNTSLFALNERYKQ